MRKFWEVFGFLAHLEPKKFGLTYFGIKALIEGVFCVLGNWSSLVFTGESSNNRTDSDEDKDKDKLDPDKQRPILKDPPWLQNVDMTPQVIYDYQVWPLIHFFLFPFCKKDHWFALRVNQVTPRRWNTFLFRSSQHLPRLRIVYPWRAFWADTVPFQLASCVVPRDRR